MANMEYDECAQHASRVETIYFVQSFRLQLADHLQSPIRARQYSWGGMRYFFLLVTRSNSRCRVSTYLSVRDPHDEYPRRKDMGTFLTTFWPDPEPTLFSGTSQHSLLTGCIVMLFQSGGSSDDIRRRADACGRNIWNRRNSFEAQEIFFEYATWSLQAHIRLCNLF